MNPSEPDWWEFFKRVVKPAARSLAGYARTQRADADDCEQVAAVWWLREQPWTKTELTGSTLESYMRVAARRAVVRGLRVEPVAEAVDSVLARLEGRTGCGPQAVAEFADLLESAPQDVGLWLRARGVEGLTLTEAQATLGWSDRYVEDVRKTAAAWLLRQVEGET